jgi:vacuolar-type H+-ATPase subunit I/STV1
MANKKKTKVKLKSVTLKLPWMNLAWESDESELKALRDLLDQLKSRRAFELNRGMMSEQPVYFLDSVVELRSEIRKLLSQLPINANESRILMLTVMDWLSEILDKWSLSMSNVNPRTWDFRRFDIHDMRDVMAQSWQVVEDVRQKVEKLQKELEKQLKLEKKKT